MIFFDARHQALIYDGVPHVRIAAAVPDAIPLHNGYVAVPASLGNMQALASHGLPTIAPLEYGYDWPGEFKPFQAQRVTASFMVLNPRGFVLNDMGCVDADTEFLSPAGWVRIADWAGECVAQYWPDTGAIEWVQPTEYVRKPCHRMIRFKTTRGVDQLLSPEHRVLLADGTVVSAQHVQDIYGPQTRSKKIKFRTTFHAPQSKGLDISDDMLRLHVAVSADGYRPGRTAFVRIKKPRKIARLRQLLDATGIPYSEHRALPEGFRRFSFLWPFPKGLHRPNFYQCSPAQLAVIADEVVHWDGTQRKAGGIGFFTRVRAEADFVQYALSSVGKRTTVHAQVRDDGVDWVVQAKEGASEVGLFGQNAGKARENVYDQASPDGFKYCFIVPSTFLLLRRNGCIFATGNTGKTMSALWAADYLMRHRPGTKALIVAPLSTLRRVWAKDIWRQFIGRRKAAVVHGTQDKRRAALAEDVDFYIINFEGLSSGVSRRGSSLVLGGLAKEIAEREDIQIVCIDEASAYRDATTLRHRSARLVVGHKRYLWQMTGTPTSNGPLDAYGLAKLAGKTSESFKSYQGRTMLQVSAFKWVPRVGAMEEAKKMLSPSVRFSIDDCVDLPPCTVQQRECELTAEQAKLYATLKREATVMIRDRQITAANEGVLRLKALQISCGAAYDAEHKVSLIDAKPRIAVLTEIIAESVGKVIVFAPLTAVLDLLNSHISDTHEVINGQVPAGKRAEIFRCFQEEKDPRVLIADPATMAHGLTLTAATTVVWYGPTDRTELYLQANKRIHRPGQTRTTTIVQIVSTPIEAEIFRRLEANETMQGVVLAIAKEGR